MCAWQAQQCRVTNQRPGGLSRDMPTPPTPRYIVSRNEMSLHEYTCCRIYRSHSRQVRQTRKLMKTMGERHRIHWCRCVGMGMARLAMSLFPKLAPSLRYDPALQAASLVLCCSL